MTYLRLNGGAKNPVDWTRIRMLLIVRIHSTYDEYTCVRIPKQFTYKIHETARKCANSVNIHRTNQNKSVLLRSPPGATD